MLLNWSLSLQNLIQPSDGRNKNILAAVALKDQIISTKEIGFGKGVSGLHVNLL